MENEAYKKYEPFFGGWYIRRLIGEGSYGKVFEIERRDPFGTVYTSALKVITVPPNSSGLEAALSDGMDRNSASLYFRDCVKELNREIALMSKLKGHSNIVSYEDHDVFQHEDGVGWDILIRMELLTPITRYLKDNRIFSHREVVQLGIDLCRALELCQRYDIIHRDIKPANIFLSDAQDFKLGDFGVARVAGAATAAYTRVGTLNYMAPEIFAGREYSGSVDIYSLGLVMYQLLNANRMPFYPPYPEPITYAAQERAHARRLGGEALPPPANTPDALARIVLKACAPDPANRYKDPAVMRHDLEAVQSAVADPNATMLMPDPVEPQPVSTEKTAVMPQENTEEREKRLQEERQRAVEEERLRMEREEAQRQKLLEEKEAELARVREEKPVAPVVPKSKDRKMTLVIGGVAIAAAVTMGGFALFGRGNASSVAASVSADATYKPGTYTATAENPIGNVMVEVTFSESAITDVKIDASDQTKGIGQEAAEPLQEAILKAQSTDVDGYAGATLTSDAVKQAVADCIAQASGERTASSKVESVAVSSATSEESAAASSTTSEEDAAASVTESTAASSESENAVSSSASSSSAVSSSKAASSSSKAKGSKGANSSRKASTSSSSVAVSSSSEVDEEISSDTESDTEQEVLDEGGHALEDWWASRSW